MGSTQKTPQGPSDSQLHREDVLYPSDALLEKPADGGSGLRMETEQDVVAATELLTRLAEETLQKIAKELAPQGKGLFGRHFSVSEQAQVDQLEMELRADLARMAGFLNFHALYDHILRVFVVPVASRSALEINAGNPVEINNKESRDAIRHILAGLMQRGVASVAPTDTRFPPVGGGEPVIS